MEDAGGTVNSKLGMLGKLDLVFDLQMRGRGQGGTHFHQFNEEGSIKTAEVSVIYFVAVCLHVCLFMFRTDDCTCSHLYNVHGKHFSFSSATVRYFLFVGLGQCKIIFVVIGHY
jgi:hypothetical protein